MIKHTMSLSASKMLDYYQCKEKFKVAHIQRGIEFVETAETLRGKKEHSILEECFKLKEVTAEAKVTFNEQTLELAERIVNLDAQLFPEIKFGINENWDCWPIKQFWDKQPNGTPFYIAGGIDLLVRMGKFSTIIDWKSGKPYKGFDSWVGKFKKVSAIEKAVQSKTFQLDLYALAEFLMNPECEAIKALYRFTTTDITLELVYTRDDDFERLLAMFMQITTEIWTQIANFPDASYTAHALATISPLCSWCGHRERCIPYNKTIGGAA